jgi:large subunit ribosomal protein L22
VRIIADEIRGRNAAYSAALLQYHPSKSARVLRKVLISAMANAQENHGLSGEDLRIATIMVDEGPRFKRMRARAQGRGNRILKKTAHITIVVEEAEPEQKVKPHGTKAKPRPSFAADRKGKKKKTEAAAPVETAEAAPVESDTGTESPAPENFDAPEQLPANEAQAEEVQAEEAQPEEATPVDASDAPEEKGGAEEPDQQEETTLEAEGATGEAEASEDQENK